jgi:hypothetical protein
MRSLISRLVALSVVAVAVAGCAGSSGTALPVAGAPNTGQLGAGQPVTNANGVGALRFLHGSPDAGKVDLCVNGSVLASAVAYKSFSAYKIVPAGVPYSVIVTAAGNGCSVTNAAPAIFTGSVIPAANTRTTVVVAGSVANSNVKVLTFAAGAAPIVVGSPQVIISNASPTAGSVAVGYFNATLGTGATALSASLAVGSASTTTALPGIASNPAAGIAFYYGTTAATTTPLASLYAGTLPAAPVPSAATASTADAKNTYSQIPFAPNDVLLNAFAIDAAAGGTSKAIFVATYDPTTYGF